MRDYIDIIRKYLLENDDYDWENDPYFLDHQGALDATGFWGSRGAGCIPFARSTKRFLLCHRSDLPPPRHVEQPGTWAGWGGAIEGREDPEHAAARETREELGYHGMKLDLVPLLVFKSGTFRYFNFLAIVDDEFTPRLNWESQGYRWCEWGQWPEPLHFGLVALFNDPDSVDLMQRAMKLKPK